MSQIGFFEDAGAANFSPIALMRPVFELLCGRCSLRERVVRRLQPSQWCVFLRDVLAETYGEDHPSAVVNDRRALEREPTLILNGRWLPSYASLTRLSNVAEDEAGFRGDTLAYLTVQPSESKQFAEQRWDEALASIAKSRRHVEADGRLLEYPWDLVEHNGEQLIADFNECERLPAVAELESQITVVGPTDRVSISPSAVLEPFVVIDTRNGPVSVDDGATIQSFTRLEGPCHVGRDAMLFRANVRESTTIGPVCRVGGEIEASILHGHVNSYHDGFLGHSYVCPWVNFGALSTNSDLKSDYSRVHVPVQGTLVDTGQTKVGCFVGDHTKTALGSLFNTGASVGVMCLILPAGRLLPKHIPSFSRFWHGELDDNLDLEATIAAAATVVERRDQRLSPAQSRLLKRLFEDTQEERKQAIARFHTRKQQLSEPNKP